MSIALSFLLLFVVSVLIIMLSKYYCLHIYLVADEKNAFTFDIYKNYHDPLLTNLIALLSGA